jgi:hypothetical protein
MGGGEGVVFHGDAINSAINSVGEGWGAGAPGGSDGIQAAVVDAINSSTSW